MLGKRRRSELRSALLHHPRLDYHPALGRTQGQRRRCGSPSAEPGRAAPSAATEPRAGKPGLTRGARDLADEALRPAAAAPCVPDPTRPDPQVVVAGGHAPAPVPAGGWLASKSLLQTGICQYAPAGLGKCLALVGELSLCFTSTSTRPEHPRLAAVLSRPPNLPPAQLPSFTAKPPPEQPGPRQSARSIIGAPPIGSAAQRAGSNCPVMLAVSHPVGDQVVPGPPMDR